MTAIQLAMEQAEANGPGVYCSKVGPEKAICIWNPNKDKTIEEEYERRLKTYLKDKENDNF